MRGSMRFKERAIYERFAKAADKADGKTHKFSHSVEHDAVLKETKPDEQLGIVSVRIEDLTGPLVEGSILGECGVCRAPVGLGPASQQIMEKRPDTRVMCVQCATVELERGGPK